MSASSVPTVLVGVVPDGPSAVVETAAALAARLGARLVCAWADPSRYTVEEAADGTATTLPIDPDLADSSDDAALAALRATVAAAVATAVDAAAGGTGPGGGALDWEARLLAGEPAIALAHLAAHLDALMIVVGSREAPRRSLREFFGGSVAVHLAHRQHRPVLIVPLSPADGDDGLPWSDAR